MMHALVFLGITLSSMAQGQFDSTSSLLFRSNGKSGKSQAPTLDSSRYKIRQPESRKGDDDDVEEKPGTYIASPVPTKTSKKSVEQNPPVVQNNNNVSAHSQTPPANPPAIAEEPATPNQTEPTAPPPVTTQVKELILGGNNKDIDEYKKAVHPEDPRANTLNVSLAPAYYYNGSSSNYSYRRYTSNGPGIGLGMNLWITPFFGIQSKYFSSVSASQKSGVNSVPTDIQNFEAGFRFRRHFGLSRKSSQLSWGLDWHDGVNKISRESTSAIGRKSAGISLALEGEIPTSNSYSHTFSLDVRPRLKHSEMNTDVEVQSGTKNETNSIALTLGGMWTLDRRNQIFWKGQYIVERNLFDGEASQPDPHNDQTPNGVSVTNSIVIFYFGFKWGS